MQVIVFCLYNSMSNQNNDLFFNDTDSLPAPLATFYAVLHHLM